MATGTATPKLDMAEIDSGIRVALNLADNTAAHAALKLIAKKLIVGHRRGAHPEYIAPALTVIEQIAAHNGPYAVTELYNDTLNNGFPVPMVQTSIGKSLGQLCKKHPAAWDLRGIAFLIETSRACFSKRGKAEVAEEFCSFAVDIAKASAQAENPQLESMAGLYDIAMHTRLASGLMAEAAKQSGLRAAKAPTAGKIDYTGICALFCTSINLHQESLSCGETGCTPSYASRNVTLYFMALERWRLKSAEKPRRPTDKIPRHALEVGYTWFSLLQNLGPQHATKQDHARQMAEWLGTNTRSEAPKTAWSIAQSNAPPIVHTISERLSEIRSGSATASVGARLIRRSIYGGPA